MLSRFTDKPKKMFDKKKIINQMLKENKKATTEYNKKIRLYA